MTRASHANIALQTPIARRAKRPIHHTAIPQLRLEHPTEHPETARFSLVMGRGPGYPAAQPALGTHLRRAERSVGVPLLNMLDVFLINSVLRPRPFPVVVHAPELYPGLARKPLVGCLRRYTDQLGMQPWELTYTGDNTWEAEAADQTIATGAIDRLLSAQSGKAELTAVELPARHILLAGLRLVVASELYRTPHSPNQA